MIMKILYLSALLSLVSVGGAFSGTLNKEYSLDYPHGVTHDYVYRTPRVYQPDGKESSWFKFWGGADNTGKTLIPAEEGTELSLRVRELVAELIATSKEPIAGELQVAVATFVNLDQLYETSALGRYLSEQMIHELQRTGVDVLEVRMMPSMKISEENGEYILSRDMGELSYVHGVDAVVAGTYVVGDGQIFLNGRLLGVENGKVLASAATVFEADGVSNALLQRASRPLASPAAVGIQSYQDLVN